MAAITLNALSHIRTVNVRQDLLAIADLIEICFSTTLDDDGRDYLRNLRSAARDSIYLSWIQGASDRLSTPLYGFVWEEQGRIVGNLSLIPLMRHGRLYYLIANVAVHPDYRRRGIGRQLTQKALDYLRQRSVDSVWLQVRDDNPAAYHLYLSLGFVERARRTTWETSSWLPSVLPKPYNGLVVESRRSQDWDLQASWLKQVYPPEVAWNLPISFKRLSPDLLNSLFRFFRGEGQHQWAARRGDQPLGFLSWEPMRASADMLWLASLPEYEDEAAGVLFPYARERLARYHRPLSINYPAGRAAETFMRAGFTQHQTLVWMRASLGER